MNIILEVTIPVERFAIFAELAFLEPRPELGVLCRAALSAGSRLDVLQVQQVLPGVSSAGARNVLRWCVSLGLCDAHGALTRRGEHAADTDEVPVPEQGVYELWVAKHPLLGARILHAERLVSRPDERFEILAPIPLEPERDRIFQSVIDQSRRLLLRDLPGNHGQTACMHRQDRSELRLRWELDTAAEQNRWQLEGTLDTGSRSAPITHEPERAEVDVWALAAALARRHLHRAGTWREQERRLALAPGDLDVDEQEQFCKTFELTDADLPDHGTFDHIELRNVPLMPASAQDAAHWVRLRLDRQLEREPPYRTRADLQRLWSSLVQDTPLEPFAPALPAHQTFLDELANRPALLWLLAAPVDLSPVETPPDFLAPLPAAMEPR